MGAEDNTGHFPGGASDSDFLLQQLHPGVSTEQGEVSAGRMDRMEARISALERTLLLALKELRDNTRVTRENSVVVKEIRDYQVAGRFIRKGLAVVVAALISGATLWNLAKDIIPDRFTTPGH